MAPTAIPLTFPEPLLRASTSRRRSRALREGGGIAAALTLLLACAPATPTKTEPTIGGPIQSSPESGTDCLTRRPGPPHPFTMGFNVVTNDGTTTATVEDLSLSQADGLTVAEAWLVPMNAAVIGDHSVFPPPGDVLETTELDWENRQPIPGAIAEPGVRYNLVLHVEADTTHPSATGIKFTYTADGKTFSWRTRMGLAVRDSC